MLNKTWITCTLLLALLLAIPITAGAQDGLDIAVITEQSCDQVSFTLTITGGAAPYHVELDFGDTEIFEIVGTTDTTFYQDHRYPTHGEYEIKVKVTDYDGLEAEFEGMLVIDGPEAALGSTPFPPLLTIDAGSASIDFEASASGGFEPYTYSWDLDQDGSPDVGLEGVVASYSYTEGGKYKAAVTVMDGCGFADTATLTVVVDDPEKDPDEACHPTAQKIAEAVSSLFPEGRSEQTYTCEDIFSFFEGALTGSQLGFGRMWKAYQLTQTIDELTWEEIRDWKLEYSSWGALTQLNRVSEFLEDYGIRDLMDLVMSEEYSLSDIRTAARSVLRFEADFEDALQRISEGANAGELGQFYKLAAEMDVDVTILDEYLADGVSLSELRHATKMSERSGSDWAEIMDAKSFGHSWGEIGQAYKLAGDEISAADILAVGVKEFRSSQREEDREQRDLDRDESTAERYAEQYAWQVGDVLDLFHGECAGNWSCVRKLVREKARSQGSNDRDLRTAAQIAAKYGVPVDEVVQWFDSTCAGDWNCVRAHYRDLNREPRGKDKDK
jgi:PKD repeat protein